MSSSLGSKIRDLRIEKGLTQGELGENLVTPSMISQIEADKANPSQRLLRALAERLQTPVEFFMTDMHTKAEQTTALKMARNHILEGEFQEATVLLEELLESPAPHLQRMEMSMELANCYTTLKRYERAQELYDEVLLGAIRDDQRSLVVQCYNKLGDVQFKMQHFNLAKHYWNKAENSLEQSRLSDQTLAAQIQLNLGIINARLNFFEEALKHYAEANTLLRGSLHMERIGDVYHGLGRLYKEMGQYKLAAEYTHDAITMFKSLNRLKQSFDVRLNLGNIRTLEGKFDDAMQLFQDCLEGYTLYGNQESIANVHCEIARLMLAKKQPDDAKVACETALRMVEPETAVAADTYVVLSNIAMQKRDFADARKWLQMAIEIFKEQEMTTLVVNCQSRLSEIYAAEGAKDEALDAMTQAFDLLKASINEMTM